MPRRRVISVKKLLSEHKIDALIGPSGSPNAVGVVPFMAEAGTPMLAPVGTTAVVLPMDDKKRWVFKTTQNDPLICEALIGHMVKAGVKTVGFIGFNDPYGENWHAVFDAQAQKAGIKVVANERFLRTDSSVTGQVAKLMAAKPDAVLVARGGRPDGAAADHAVRCRLQGPHLPDPRRGDARFPAPGRRQGRGHRARREPDAGAPRDAPTASPPRPSRSSTSTPTKRCTAAKPATFGANVYDAGLLLTRAVPEAARRGKPGTPEFRAALRDALEGTRELVGTQGVYNMSPADHSGFDERGRVLITVKDGNWRLLKD